MADRSFHRAAGARMLHREEQRAPIVRDLAAANLRTDWTAHELAHLTALSAVGRADETAVIGVSGLHSVRHDPQIARGVEREIVGIRERAELLDIGIPSRNR